MEQLRSLTALLDYAKRIGAEKGPRKVAIALAEDAGVLEAIEAARKEGFAFGILVGNGDKITTLARAAGYEIPAAQIIHEPDDAQAARKAIALIREGKADLLMKGKIKTSALVKAVLDKENGLHAGRLLSQVIVFPVPGFDRLMISTDAAINIAPTLEQKAELIRNTVEVARMLGIEKPNVALLCALEFPNPEMPATIDASALTLMNRRGQIGGCYVEGPIALDVPLSKFAADRKGISSPLAENTDIFISPDIEAANILYRAILYFAKGESGGIVVGARVPLILLSRAETPETKIRSIALGVLAARAKM